MGLLDKLKNVFFEEEYVEVEDAPEKPEKIKKQEKVKENKKEIKKEMKKEKKEIAKRIETPKREKIVEEEIIEEDEIEEEIPQEVLSDRELLKPDTSFKLFEDDDFSPEIKMEVEKSTIPPIERKEEKVPYGGVKVDLAHLYKGEQREKEFHPTPIISPIYGILDKNYSKEDIVDKKEKRGVSSYARKIDLDSVRKKAYGELSNDLDLAGDDPVIDKEVDVEEELEDNLLYDMSEQDTTPAVEKVTLADAEEYFEDLGLEYNIDYKDKSQEKASGRRVRHTPVIEEEEDDDDIPPGEKRRDSRTSKVVEDEEEDEEDTSLEDNLFDLIDSMYEDKE